LGALHTKAVGTVTANVTELPKETFSGKKGGKLSAQKDDLLAKNDVMKDVFLLSTVHDDSIVDVPDSRGFHYKNKPVVIINDQKHKSVWTNPTICWHIILSN
jgi:hypothetical protein